MAGGAATCACISVWLIGEELEEHRMASHDNFRCLSGTDVVRSQPARTFQASSEAAYDLASAAAQPA